MAPTTGHTFHNRLVSVAAGLQQTPLLEYVAEGPRNSVQAAEERAVPLSLHWPMQILDLAA